MQPHGRTVERELARLAHGSHGVVTRGELVAAGLSAEEIKQRLRRGALIRVHRGVFRVGHVAPSREARYMAAVRACGEGALLAGLAAAHLHALITGREPAPEVLARTERKVPGVVAGRARRGEMGDAVVRLGIPVISVPRTLVSVAARLPEGRLARACHEAEVRHDVTPRDVEAILARRPTDPGVARLRAMLHGESRITLSQLERVFLALLDEVGLPLPRTNRPAGGRRVDARWPDIRLTVELDGYRFHRSRHAWEQDRRREREAYARGDDFRRYTYGDVLEHPEPMLRELRGLLDVRRRPEVS
ncbi:MAG: type IV toxin-antitoxin system AbiEi family antitoxin domain-containing protein [Thermoleophilaceae bacterium]|nr:type IV toxin-antitoxin system AbiEi family antitoxin domain-containing protein [Thermoleophilaceae bacterium]